MTEPREERLTVDVDGEPIDLGYRVAGDGPPLVCVHGIGIDAARVGWRDAPAKLGDGHTVYALDLPNHGASDASNAVRTTAEYVDVFGGFLDALGLDAPTLAGLSMGGAVVLGHVLDGGDAERLVLVDSYGLGADAPWRTAAGLAVRMPFADAVFANSLSSRAGVRTMLSGLVADGIPEDLLEDVRGTADGTSLRAMRRWQRHEFRPDGLRTNHRDRLCGVTTPTLLVHGEDDPLLPASWSVAAHERLPDSELYRLPDVGHWPPREAPGPVYEAIRAFAN